MKDQDELEDMREIEGKEVQQLEQKPLFEIIREDEVLREAILGRENFVVGMKVIPFNAKMRVARKSKGLSQYQLEEKLGISKGRISHIETFRFYPDPQLAKEIAEILEVKVEELFPEWLRFYLREARSMIALREFTSEQIEQLQLSGCLLPATIDPEEETRKQLLKEEIRRAIHSLDDARAVRVLKLRYGLEGNPLKQEQVADILGLSPSRIGQIETQAIKELRNPRISRRLRDFL